MSLFRYYHDFIAVAFDAGGAIRRLDKHEDGGRRFGIEIIEGHDLSEVQPSLIQFAKQQLQRLIKDDTEQKLAR